MPNVCDEDGLLRLANEDLRALLESLGVSADSCVEPLEQYRLLLQEEAAKWNITKYRKTHEIILYHFVDSLQALKCEGLERECEVIDVGTGAGLPGVPCASVRPGWRITLLDSSEKHGRFLGVVAQRLLPDRARVIVDRAEVTAHRDSERGRYDLVLARAVAPLPILLELALPFLKPSGLFLAHRGAAWQKDLAVSAKAIETLCGEFVGAHRYRLRGRDREHGVLVVRLSSPPDDRYPRSAARIRREPLG